MRKEYRKDLAKDARAIVLLLFYMFPDILMVEGNKESLQSEGGVSMATVAHRLPEQKRVTITSKRQFTIPQKYYTELGFDKDALCIMGDGFLILRPTAKIPSGDFAEQILADLIAEGFSGQELLDEFKTRQAKVRPGVEAMLEAAKAVAQGLGDYSTYDSIFGSED